MVPTAPKQNELNSHYEFGGDVCFIKESNSPNKKPSPKMDEMFIAT